MDIPKILRDILLFFMLFPYRCFCYKFCRSCVNEFGDVSPEESINCPPGSVPVHRWVVDEAADADVVVDAGLGVLGVTRQVQSFPRFCFCFCVSFRILTGDFYVLHW